MRELPRVLTRSRVEIALVDDGLGVPGFGCVEAVGAGVEGVRAGEVVFFSAELGRVVRFMGEELVMVGLEDVMAVLDEVPSWVVDRLKEA